MPTCQPLSPDQVRDLSEAVGRIAALAAKALHAEYPHLDLEGLFDTLTRDSAAELTAIRYLDAIDSGKSPGEAAGEAGKALILAWADARLTAQAHVEERTASS